MIAAALALIGALVATATVPASASAPGSESVQASSPASPPTRAALRLAEDLQRATSGLAAGPTQILAEGAAVRVRFAALDLFAVDAVALRPDAEPALAAIADTLKRRLGRSLVEVRGYSDAYGVRAWNETFTLDRARSVGDALKRLGVPDTQMTVTGLGEAEPLAESSTAEGRRSNRRVEIVIRPRS